MTNAREVNQQAIYGSPSEEDVFWKRLTDLLYNDEQPEAGQLETQGGESTMEGSDDVPLSANYRLVAPVSRHLIHRFSSISFKFKARMLKSGFLKSNKPGALNCIRAENVSRRF